MKVHRAMTLRLDPTLNEYLRRHAFERGVSRNKLIEDVLTLWVKAATDPTDPLFSQKTMGLVPLAFPQESYPGYLDSLVFRVE